MGGLLGKGSGNKITKAEVVDCVKDQNL